MKVIYPLRINCDVSIYHWQAESSRKVRGILCVKSDVSDFLYSFCSGHAAVLKYNSIQLCPKSSLVPATWHSFYANPNSTIDSSLWLNFQHHTHITIFYPIVYEKSGRISPIASSESTIAVLIAHLRQLAKKCLGMKQYIKGWSGLCSNGLNCSTTQDWRFK